MQQKIKLISQKLNIAEERVLGALRLLEDGATIPFIARYRKEATGGLDEVEIAAISDESEKFDELVKRKEFVIEAIEAAGALTDELKARIENSWDATEIEDIYLPYKQKKRTRATIAREAGLEPLAKIIMGIVKPDSGTILFNGTDITNFSIDERARLGIGFAFQQPVIFKGLTVKDMIELAAGEQ